METNYHTTDLENGAEFYPERKSYRDGRKAGVLSLDPGMHLGWAYKSGGFIAAGSIDLEEKGMYGRSYNFVIGLITRFRPERIVVEEYFSMSRAIDTRTIEQRGALKAAVEHAGREWMQIHPATVRRHLGLNGRPTDPQIRQSVTSYFGTPEQYVITGKNRKKLFRPDVFDALALLMADEMLLAEKDEAAKKKEGKNGR